MLLSQFAEISPGIDPSFVPVVEHDPNSVATHWKSVFDAHIAFVSDNRLAARMALNFRRGAFDAQQLKANGERSAVVISNPQNLRFTIKRQIDRPRLPRSERFGGAVGHSSGPSSRASSTISTGTPSRIG